MKELLDVKNFTPRMGADNVLLLAMSLTSILGASPQSKPAQSSTASSQDKVKACNDAADKKGLTGADRKSYVEDCMKKANPQ